MWIPEETYKGIIKNIPIPCVDLLVVNEANEILLVKRLNEPAKGQWWFPGGRVHIGETRKDAAIRKLNEECGIQSSEAEELKTYDLFLPLDANEISHAITTVFRFKIKRSEIILDHQSEDYSFRPANDWAKVLTNEFLLREIKNHQNKK